SRAVQVHPLSVFDWIGSLMGVLGSAEVTGPLALVLVALVWRRSPRVAVALAVGFAVAIGIEAVFKDQIAHSGPPIAFWRPYWTHLPSDSVVLAGSFPSGHTLRTV